MGPCNQNVCAYHVFVIVLMFILVYGYCVKEKYVGTDVLEKKFIDIDGCDYWAFTHFTLYMILGYMFPTHFVLFFSVGLGYEVAEYLIGATQNPIKSLGATSDNGDQSWWYGRYTDIIFNTLGLLTGIFLANQFGSKTKKCGL